MFENERKFLVKEVPKLEGIKYSLIEQGYLSFTPEVRIRKKNDKYFLTHKGEGNQIRTEVESEIDKVTYDILMLLVQERFINKTRYEVELSDGIIAELDVYHGDLEGLVVVETEFKTSEQASLFTIPSWFGKEVTSDKRYKNKMLASCENIQDFLKDIL